MKALITLVLAGAAAAALANDPTTYRAAKDKATTDYKVAIAKCSADKGYQKDVCTDQAKADRAHAEADAAAQFKQTDRELRNTRVAAVDADYKLARTKCADQSGDAKDTCLSNAKATHTTAVADAKAGTNSSWTQQTKDVATTAVDKTVDATARAGDVMSDSMITTTVKADIFKEPNLKSTGIHVETNKGVVLLSGFVNTQTDADRAVQVARGVKGVTEVKSAIKVK